MKSCGFRWRSMLPIKRDWKCWLGIGLLAWSCLAYVVILLLPLTSLSLAAAGSVATGVFISAEVAFLLSVILLGRPFIMALWNRIKSWFRRSEA